MDIEPRKKADALERKALVLEHGASLIESGLAQPTENFVQATREGAAKVYYQDGNPDHPSPQSKPSGK